MCIVRWLWWVYLSFSTCISAVHQHHRTWPADTSAKLNHTRRWHSGKNWPCSERVITEFMNKGWTKNSISRLLIKFRTVDKRLGSVRRIAHADENVDTVESLLLSQEDKPQSQEKFHMRRGDPSIISFADYSQSFASPNATRKGALNSWLKRSMHALFSVCSLRDDNVITSKRTWKLKHANSTLETCEYFCQISSKSIHIISSYTVSKLGRFLRHSVVISNCF